jgi:hypothetical protein
LREKLEDLAESNEKDELIKFLAPKPTPEKPVYKNRFRKQLEEKSRLNSQ